MRFFLQFGVPGEKPRYFLSPHVDPHCKVVEEVEADSWKDARLALGPLPKEAPEGAAA